MKRVYLEITNACNLNCPFCTENKGHDFMKLADVKKYLKQISEISNYVYLHVLGEPLLHPDFEAILDYLDELKLNLQLVTNGTLLAKYPNILKHQCLRKLSISLHSINQLPINDNYFNTINNLIENNQNKVIELRFYDYEHLDEKLKLFLDHLKELYGPKNTKKLDSYKLKDKVYFYHQELFNWPSLSSPFISDSGSCHGLIDQIAILHNGEVTSCCLDPNGYNTFGNLNANSLKEILNSELYLNSLKALKARKLTLKLCQHCSYRLRFDHNNN